MTPPDEPLDEPLRHTGVVIHLDEDAPAKHEAVLRNITNLLHEVTEDTPVELVAHGPGVGVLLSSNPHASGVRDLHSRGVRFVACANTLAQMAITPARLVDGVSVAPSGVGRLVRRQQQGWAYLRP